MYIYIMGTSRWLPKPLQIMTRVRVGGATEWLP